MSASIGIDTKANKGLTYGKANLCVLKRIYSMDCLGVYSSKMNAIIRVGRKAFETINLLSDELIFDLFFGK